MQRVGILALLSRIVTVVNNATSINLEDRHTLQNLTETAILLCSGSSDLRSPKQLRSQLLDHTSLHHGPHDHGDDPTIRAHPSKIENNRTNQPEVSRGCEATWPISSILRRKVPKPTSYLREVKSPGYQSDSAKDKIPTVQLSKVPEEEPDVTLRCKVQVVSESKTLVPCVAHVGETRPALEGNGSTSYVLLQNAWCQLEEARVFCEKLETPPQLKPKDEFPAKHIITKENAVSKTVCNVATQEHPQNIDNLGNSDIESPLQRENVKLRSLLRKSRRVLEHTYAKLAAANERKRSVEVMSDRQDRTIQTAA